MKRPPAVLGKRILIGIAAAILLAGLGLAGWATLAASPADRQEAGRAAVALAGGAATPAPLLRDAQAVHLGPVPDPALIVESEHGALPVSGPDGRQPWRAYARPFLTAGNRPRIAIVVTDIGLNAEASRQAIQHLPPEVSVAISPYTENGQDWVRAARAAGHEVLLAVPMEPTDYPNDDPGPLTLLTSLSDADNLTRLQRAMGGISGYVGIINQMGSRFTAARSGLSPVMDALSHHGLMFVDAAASRHSVAPALASETGVPRAIVNRRIDETPLSNVIRLQLEHLERVAEAYGAAVGLAQPLPVSIHAVQDWAAALEESGMRLAPVSAVANRQPLPR